MRIVFPSQLTTIRSHVKGVSNNLYQTHKYLLVIKYFLVIMSHRLLLNTATVPPLTSLTLTHILNKDWTKPDTNILVSYWHVSSYQLKLTAIALNDLKQAHLTLTQHEKHRHINPTADDMSLLKVQTVLG